MKKIIFMLLFLFLINIYKVKADLTDYNGGSASSLGGLGSGAWCDTCVGLKISILSSDETVEDSEIVLNNKAFNTPAYFSTDMNPKFKQGDTSISWIINSNITYYKSDLIPGDWNPNSTIINFNDLLSKNDYSLLKSLLGATNGSNKIFTTLSSGDYIVVEPMTKISSYYGTAFELSNSFSLLNNCSTSGSFCNKYSGAVFGGNSKNTNGGIFYNTIYIDESVLGLTKFSSSNYSSNERNKRNTCFTDRTCGRGIGVFKYDDIFEPEPERYTLDLNYCVDGQINWDLHRYPTNFSYDFKLNGTNNDSTYFLESIESGTSYEVSNVVETSADYIFKGYHVGTSGSCTVNDTSDSVSGTVTSDTSINLVFELGCDKKLQDLKNSDGTYNPSDLFDLYKFYLDKSGSEKKDYRGLLNIANPSCTTKSAPSKEITNLTCLSASTMSHANFSEVNLSDYDESIQNAQGKYVGFCLSSMYLKNNLGAQKFYSKSGRFLIKQETDDSEIEIYNSNYNPQRVCGNDVATTTIRKICYVLPGEGNDYNYTSADHVSLYFGDNNIDTKADRLLKEKDVIINDGASGINTTNVLKMHEYKKEIKYKLNTVYLSTISGKTVSSGSNYLNGVLSKFNATSGTIPFKITYKGKTYGENKDLCTYETKPELINQSNKLSLEYRIIDTINPFNRRTMSNWSYGTDNSKDNDTVKKYIKEAVNSYGIDKDGKKVEPLYKIELTPNDIKNIREYNKSVPYDNYNVECNKDPEGNEVCENTFLKNLRNQKVIIYNEITGEVVKTLTNKNKLILTNSNKVLSGNTGVNNNIINGVDITKKICTPVTSSTNGNVPTGNYNIGDEYVCEVAPGVRYNFFAVGTCGEDKVNLIMDKNLVNSIAWINKTDYLSVGGKDSDWGNSKYNIKGPITALNELTSRTSSWINIVSYNYTLIDEINDFSSYYKDLGLVKDEWHPSVVDPDYERYSPVEQENVKARLLTRNEANNCGCTRFTSTCPIFLSGSGSGGYWLSNAANSAYQYVDTACGSDIVNDGGDYSYAYRTDAGGIRPVITVYKSQISN